MSAAEKTIRGAVAITQPKWRRCRDLVDDLLARAGEPWVSIALGGDELVSVRAGGIVLLIGGTGRGKTSLAVTLLVEHAQHAGPAIAMSLELPSDEWTARAIGGRCDASWGGVLRGEVPRAHMIAALPERLAVIARRDASLEVLRAAVRELRAEDSDRPVLVAVDYVQLMENDEREVRRRVAAAMRQLDDFAREERVVVIALSQGSRASSRDLASSDKLGAETTDTGAEAAELERWSTATLAIGALGSPAEDGSQTADLSIGKSRMGAGGDTVHAARIWGRSGRWRLVGDAKPASEVRAARKAEQDRRDIDAAKLAMIAGAQRAKEPVTGEDLRKFSGRNRDIARAAQAELLADGELARVKQKKPRSREWKLWTPSKAAEAGIPLVSDGE